MDDIVFKISDQLNTVNEGYSHIVILGAGASRALCLNQAEKNGKSTPLMDDLPKIIDLSDELKDLPDFVIEKNFEQLFSFLSKQEPNSARVKSIEHKIYEYFHSLKISENPTIYDYLILSLRKKDLIATFNWDPFLWCIKRHIRPHIVASNPAN